MSLLDRVRDNRSLTLAFWGTGVVLLAWQMRAGVSVAGPGARLRQDAAAPAALHPDVLPPGRLRLLGLLLGAGLPVSATAGRPRCCSPTPSTCCSRGRAGGRSASASGRCPIVFSTNLFLWFKDDWFAFQFLLIAIGFLGKAFVQWERDGRRGHIFNPSAFALALFSLRAHRHRHDLDDLGAGDQHDLRAGAAHLPGAVPHRPGRDVLLLDHLRDGLGRRDAVRAERALRRRHRRAVFRRHRDSVGGVPRPAPARHRSVHLAAHAARPRRSSASPTASASSRCTRCSARSACRPSTTSCCACRCSTCWRRRSTGW